MDINISNKNKYFYIVLTIIVVSTLVIFLWIYTLNRDKNSVSYNGWLHTSGAVLLNEKNEPIQLRGLSSHGIQWYSDLLTYENLKSLKNDWNINIFRIAMYTNPADSGYISNPEELKNKVYEIADWAIDLDMYVIIDWHILNDSNPQTYKEEAKVFFDEVSKKYADAPNVIYEICNEPNRNDVEWDEDIKPYAEEIIPVIRANSPKSLIIVGTPDWCKKLNKAADNPLNFENILYACHFYAGSHGNELREKIDYCISKNIPIFVSECGITDATGDGEIYEQEFREWINYLNSKEISWVYWSFSEKAESSAIISPPKKTPPKGTGDFGGAGNAQNLVSNSEGAGNAQNLTEDFAETNNGDNSETDIQTENQTNTETEKQNNISTNNEINNKTDVDSSKNTADSYDADSYDADSYDFNNHLTPSGVIIKEILTSESSN